MLEFWNHAILVNIDSSVLPYETRVLIDFK